MVWVDVVCPEESSDTVEGYANRSMSGQVPVEITNLSRNKFRVTFQAKHAESMVKLSGCWLMWYQLVNSLPMTSTNMPARKTRWKIAEQA